MLTLYKYIFFVIYKKYIEWGEEDMPGHYAIGVITLLQTIFIEAITFYLNNIYPFFAYVNKMHAAYLCIVLMTFNYWYIYKKVGKFEIIVYWEKESKSRRKKMGLLMALHFIVTFGLFVLAEALRK